MPVPAYIQLFQPILTALHELGGSGSNTEILERVIRDLGLPPRDVEALHGTSGRTELEHRLTWARTQLKKFGLIDNSERGIWSLSAKGQATTTVNPREIVPSNNKESRPQESKKGHSEPADDAGEAWRAELLQTMRDLSPEAFERLCQRLLRESGFVEVEVTKRSGDGGIDGFGTLRLGGLISFTVSFQSKRYQGSVGPNIVRDFRGGMSGLTDKGLLITTGTFTSEAKKEAIRDSRNRIDLVDGEQLVDKFKELRLGLKTREIEEVEVDDEWFKVI